MEGEKEEEGQDERLKWTYQKHMQQDWSGRAREDQSGAKSAKWRWTQDVIQGEGCRVRIWSLNYVNFEIIFFFLFLNQQVDRDKNVQLKKK